MPNVIKYTTGATPTGCLRKGNMAIGNNTADYSSTFYSAIEPPPDGYTIYLNKASGGPSIYVANNDSELITLTNQIASTSYTTVNECLTYFTSQSDKLIVSSNDIIPSIITDGLVLALDASNISSYPTTGTTWYDLSGNNNGTLVNSPTFNISGAIDLDGSDDHINIPYSGNTSNSYTFTIIMKCDTMDDNSSNRQTLFGLSQNGNQAYKQFDLEIWGNVGYGFKGDGGPTEGINFFNFNWPTNGNTNINNVYTVTLTSTEIKVYLNGTLKATKNSSNYLGALLTSDFNSIYLGVRGSGGSRWNGQCYYFSVYNRILSADEVLQNYNAQYALGTKLNPADSAVAILSSNPGAPDGYYWINTSLGPRKLHCLMSLGGWMGMTSELCPQTSNVETSGSWETNTDGRLQRENFSILNVNVVEGGCGNVKYYQLQNPSNVGLNYTQKMLLIERVSTIGQCSSISNGSGNGYYSGPEYQGSYTSAGMCTWGDGNFANTCCGAQNMTGLKRYWVMLGTGTNPNLYYQVQCAGGSGQHYHMWYIK